MPATVIRSFAKQSGKTEKEVDKIWNDTKEEVKKKFKNESPAFWAYVNKSVQYKLGIAEDLKITFRDFLMSNETI